MAEKPQNGFKLRGAGPHKLQPITNCKSHVWGSVDPEGLTCLAVPNSGTRLMTYFIPVQNSTARALINLSKKAGAVLTANPGIIGICQTGLHLIRAREEKIVERDFVHMYGYNHSTGHD